MKLAAMLLLGLTGCPLWAASFDCAKATTPQERAICASGKLSDADSALAAAYKSALAKLPAASAAKLRADERDWNSWVAMVCGAAQSANLTRLAECMLGPFGERTQMLARASQTKDGVLFLQRSHYLAVPEKQDEHSSGVTFPGFGTLTAEWPEAQSDDPAWAAWNSGVLAFAHEMAGGAKGASPAQWPTDYAEGGDYDVTLLLRSIRSGRVLVAGGEDGMGHGAAHPNESSANLTWLLQQRRALRPEDVFAAGSKWKAALAAACWRDLRTPEKREALYAEVNGPTAKALLDVVGDVRNWTLTKAGLQVSYGEYAVSPRASPVDDTTVPWKTLEPVLAPGFTP